MPQSCEKFTPPYPFRKICLHKDNKVKRRPSQLEKLEGKLAKEDNKSYASDIQSLTRSLTSVVDVDVHKFVSDLFACKPDTKPDTAYHFKWEYLRSEILSKWPHNDSGVPPHERASKAIAKMLTSDDRCQTINTSGFGSVSHDHINHEYISRARMLRILGLAKYYVQEIMGSVPKDIYKDAVFTSGASFLFTKRRGDAYYKYNSDVISVTPKARRKVQALIDCTPLWRESLGSVPLRLVLGDQTDTVDKNAEIDRTIKKQPEGNLLLQGCIGRQLRRRLLAWGVDLRDQTTNQEFARRGSIHGDIATIDWSSASDSISDLLVFTLVSDEWYEEMDTARCSRGLLPDGSVRAWSGFSAMGNGFTFELESILFYGITLACCHEKGGSLDDCSIYGDDTICPSEVAPLLMDVMAHLGFLPNKAKTFSTGPFRESCGKHYYNGVDVSPFYLRGYVDSHSRVCWLLNQLRKWADSKDGSNICDPSVYSLWLKYRRKYIPKELLGGKNIEDVTTVCSPEGPRLRLIAKQSYRDIDGISALLRSFQSMPEAITIEPVRLGDMFYTSVEEFITKSGVPFSVLTKYCQYTKYFMGIPRYNRYYANFGIRESTSNQRIISQRSEVLYLGIKPNRDWCTPIPLFPNEING